jgi:hypothetical protein
MRRRAGALAIAVPVLAGLGLTSMAGRGAAALEDFGGLPQAPGQEEVFYNCGACHSIRLVTQQRLSRQRWDHLLDWMVEKQGMVALETDERSLILDYLATYYGQDVPRS